MYKNRGYGLRHGITVVNRTTNNSLWYYAISPSVSSVLLPQAYTHFNPGDLTLTLPSYCMPLLQKLVH
jgi:hypothetical protein